MTLSDLFESGQKIIWAKRGDEVKKTVVSDFVIPERRKFELIKKEDEQDDEQG